MVQNVQRILTKCIVDLLCDFRSNAFDLPGCQIADDAFSGVGDYFLIALNFKLQAVSRMLDPMAVEFVTELISDG